MIKSNMSDCSREGSKPNAISEGKESAKVQLAVPMIPGHVEIKGGRVEHTWDVVRLALAVERVRRKDGEFLRIVHVAKIRHGCLDIHYYEEADHDVNDSEAGCGNWVADESYCGPVEAEWTDPQPS